MRYEPVEKVVVLPISTTRAECGWLLHRYACSSAAEHFGCPFATKGGDGGRREGSKDVVAAKYRV